MALLQVRAGGFPLADDPWRGSASLRIRLCEKVETPQIPSLLETQRGVFRIDSHFLVAAWSDTFTILEDRYSSNVNLSNQPVHISDLAS